MAYTLCERKTKCLFVNFTQRLTNYITNLKYSLDLSCCNLGTNQITYVRQLQENEKENGGMMGLDREESFITSLKNNYSFMAYLLKSNLILVRIPLLKDRTFIFFLTPLIISCRIMFEIQNVNQKLGLYYYVV